MTEVFGEWPEHRPGMYRAGGETSNTPDIPDEYGTAAIGPFNPGPYWRLSVNGYEVPFMCARPGQDGTWDVFLDDRFAFTFPSQEAMLTALPLVANAMAIAAGYSCFGKNSQAINRFRCRLIGLGSGDVV